MKKISIFSALMVLLLMAGCDYNEKHFEGFDDIKIPDVAQFEGAYTGSYPDGGYFTDKGTLAASVNTMLKGIYSYCDAGSTAKVSGILFGDITPGFSAADASYTLAKEDYDSMGEESGQPGRYDNFDGNMDVDNYLIEFCDTKYADLGTGKIVSITYLFYASGAGTAARVSSYMKTAGGWEPYELEAFAADMNYLLVTEDYDVMGTESGTPGRYDNFDANMDVDFYLSTFLGIKFPFTNGLKTCAVTYLYYASGSTTEQTRIYKHDDNGWSYFDPYADTVEVTAKVAEMSFDGTAWKLDRLLGGSVTYTMGEADYTLLVEWVKENKAEYMSSQNPKEEFYFGSSAAYFNINNNYNTWRTYYNIDGSYTGKSDDDMQEVMNERMAEGLGTIILPNWVSKPDPGLSYVVIYKIYSGKFSGMNAMSLMYNEETGIYERVGGPVKQ